MCGKLMQYCQATAKLGHRLRKQMILREDYSALWLLQQYVRTFVCDYDFNRSNWEVVIFSNTKVLVLSCSLNLDNPVIF